MNIYEPLRNEMDIKNHLKLADVDDKRDRNDFKYRYVYDFVKTYLGL